MPAPASRPLISFDWAIKRLLRQKANYGILEGFLTELLKQDVFIKNIPESEANKTNAEDKSNKVDILCENDKGELLLIELQYYNEWDFLHRMLFGASKLITDYMKEGEPYGNVKKIFSINIVYFEIGQGTDYVYYGKTSFHGLHHHDELKMTAAQQNKLQKEQIHQIFPEYFIIKVNNFDNIARDNLDEWIYYFKNNALPDRFKAKGLDKVEAQLKIDAMTKQEKMDYDAHIKNLRISQSMLETAKLEGKTEANRNFIISLIKNTGFTNEKIASLVGVDIAWVKSIRQELSS